MQQERKRSAVGELEARRLVESRPATALHLARLSLDASVSAANSAKLLARSHPVEAGVALHRHSSLETAGGGVSDGGVGCAGPLDWQCQ